jgi:hypothetical protein
MIRGAAGLLGVLAAELLIVASGCADDEAPRSDAGDAAGGSALDGPLDRAAELAVDSIAADAGVAADTALAADAADAILDAGPDRTVYGSHEAQYCSRGLNEDPYYQCSPAFDLVCATTHQELLRPGTFVERFLCRLRCTPGDRCPIGADICCPGRDPAGGAVNVCVPEPQCQSRAPDAGA